jgi:putative ABC transport system permease protein
MSSASRPLLRIAWRNLRKHARHSLGTILSIVVGFIAIGLFAGYLADLNALQRDWYVHRGMMGHVIIEKRGASGSEGREDAWKYSLRTADQAFVERYLVQHANEVAVRVRILQLAGLASTGRSGVMFVGWGLDVTESAMLRDRWAWNVSADCTGPPPATAIGPSGTPTGEHRPITCRQPLVQLSCTTETGQLNVIDPTIVGLFDAGLKDIDNRFLHLPLHLAQQLTDTTAISMYAVLLRDERDVDSFVAQMSAAASARGLDLAVIPWYEHEIAELYRRTESILAIYRNLVVLIVVAIAGMSVLTTMLKSVNERVREIGTLRSLGFRQRHIVGLFTIESALLAVTASAMGFVATTVMAAVINGSHISYDGGVAATPIPLTVSVVPGACAFAVLFLSGVAVLAALVPARRAARLAIPDALGHV